ncbi:hypothetical protein [Pseudovibrio brasiliensis]|uniref:Uncharacterized protein n=1 Tax=Pseudovibrio brasiliensis TaxID=1898042 RepID=A0ABX8AVD6_9HYPH|nr:hypothetical protein [Pseudovibrio brasiliensis]QUS59029.1 hypothetical protein KGB56_26430 [Pseudovibrio brasiliensis]
MGEAKQKREKLKIQYLNELDEWSFDPSDWERQMVKEILDLPTVKVTRYPKDVLEWMRMPPRQCHANARFMEENASPSDRIKQVAGWWILEGNLVLHSVINQAGQYACVTPLLYDDNQTFEFIPDPEIKWRNDGDYRTAFRGGQEIGKGLRINPEASLKRISHIRAKLDAGLDIYEAMRL